MRNTRFILGAVIVMLIPVAQAEAVGSPIQKENRTVAQATNIESPPHATKDQAVAEAKSTVAPNEPEENFRNARASFLEKNAQAAAAQIRKGAAFLKLEASHATGEVKEALTASVAELQRLAQGVEKGAVTSTQELRRAFARADEALAKQHLQKATESWSKKEIKKTGQEIKSAVNDVEMASAWAGRKLDAATAAAIKDAHAVAAKLTENAGWTTREVSKGLDAVGKEIENLGKQI